jgi:hypothetical protein
MSEEKSPKLMINSRSIRNLDITVSDRNMTLKIIDLAFHRNGTCGEPFHVALFRDPYGLKVGIVFETDRHCAVLDIDQLADDDIRFASNSWRGDMYEDLLRDAIELYGDGPE